jgi:hypothetical protein
MSPLTAYPELERLNQSTFDYFLKGKQGVVKPEPGTGNLIIELGSPEPGGVVMCGTTGDLKTSLNDFITENRLHGVWSELLGDPLAVYCCRGKSSKGAARTMVNIGPLKKWWGSTSGDPNNFKPRNWNFLRGPMSRCSFVNLSSMLDDAEKHPALSW